MGWFGYVAFYFFFFNYKAGNLRKSKREWNSLLVAKISQVVVANATKLWREYKLKILLWLNYREENIVMDFVGV